MKSIWMCSGVKCCGGWEEKAKKNENAKHYFACAVCEIFASVKLSGDDDKNAVEVGREMMIKFSCSQKPSKRHDTMASFAPEEMKTLLRSPFCHDDGARWRSQPPHDIVVLTGGVYVHKAKSNLITNNEC